MASLTFINSITSIKNSVKARKEFCVIKGSKLLMSSLTILERESFILGFRTDDVLNFVTIIIPSSEILKQKWWSLKIISRPSAPVYASVSKLRYLDSYSTSLILLSTSKGVLTISEALRLNTGGEILVSNYPLTRNVIFGK